MGTRLIIERPWCAPKGAKRARIQELGKEHMNDLHRMEAARAAVIMQAKSIVERARKSSSDSLLTARGTHAHSFAVPDVTSTATAATAPLAITTTAAALSPATVPVAVIGI